MKTLPIIAKYSEYPSINAFRRHHPQTTGIHVFLRNNKKAAVKYVSIRSLNVSDTLRRQICM